MIIGHNYTSTRQASRFGEIDDFSNLLLLMFRKVRQLMKLPYGYVLIDREVAVHEEKADVVRSIFGAYLAGASLGKIVDLLFKRGVASPTGKAKWTRAAIDKLLANKKYIPMVGVKVYMDAQFEKARRCNVDYEKAGHPRKAVRYQSPSFVAR